MCGIIAFVSRLNHLPPDILEDILPRVKRRGPDATGIQLIDLGNGLYLHMISCVLHLRGKVVIPQPYVNGNGDILQWNGDVFGGLEVEEDSCDTVKLACRLNDCVSENEICNVFSSLQGPYAFVFYHKSTQKLYFGRDYFGRRSLLYREDENGFFLTSVAKKPVDKQTASWSEIQADGIFVINTQLRDFSKNIHCHYWKSVTNPQYVKADIMRFHNPQYLNKISEICKPSQSDLIQIECNVEPFQTIDINVTKLEVSKMSDLETLTAVCSSQNMWPTVDIFIDSLKTAVRKRVFNVPKKTNSCSSVGVLFSGGIDCTVIALLADEYVPNSESINLFNVAFETPKNKGFDVPDRISGRQSYTELSNLCPDRNWNFVEINVSLKELKEMRQKRIADLTYPLSTVLDDSIACALWFAVRGASANQQFDTKVVLCGMGADEQLCGYSRHRSAFENHGWMGLENEIKMELERISSRNLGRDNRVIADHGMDARFPYLDENVISCLNKIPLCYKANLNYRRGIGEKLLLRASAYGLGLRGIAVLPKRAIQFGSRIAKAEHNREKASDVCNRLL